MTLMDYMMQAYPQPTFPVAPQVPIPGAYTGSGGGRLSNTLTNYALDKFNQDQSVRADNKDIDNWLNMASGQTAESQPITIPGTTGKGKGRLGDAAAGAGIGLLAGI